MSYLQTGLRKPSCSGVEDGVMLVILLVTVLWLFALCQVLLKFHGLTAVEAFPQNEKFLLLLALLAI
jgi:hypothetical protein